MLNLKKSFISVIVLAVIIACFTGCNSKNPITTIDITESTFMSQLTNIQSNPASYTGKTIKIEGVFEADEHNGHSHYYVYRNASVYDPDHKHDHIQKIGLEFSYKGNMPKDNDWIEVVGVLRDYTENGHNSLRLEANSVKVLSERGAEMIGNTEAAHDD